MVILYLFSFLAGIVTVLSPCILPVLPAILSGGIGKGSLRPAGIVFGLIVSFTFFTLTIATLVQATGISANILRYVAIAIIAAFGLVMIFPRLSDWFADNTASVANVGVKIQIGEKGSGFWSGFLLGIALGLVWTPCAGPILAAITTLVASNKITTTAVFITLWYSAGAALPMFLIAYGGNRILTSSKVLKKHTEQIRQGFGILMIATAATIAFHFDVWFQQLVLSYFPPVMVEDLPAVKQELTKLRQGSEGNKPAFAQTVSSEPSLHVKTGELANLGLAPDFVGITAWINSDPLTIEKLKNKIVLVDFWTYSCINCIRTFPYLKRWYDIYKDKGLVIVGVHTPEFEFEKDLKNVEVAVKMFGIKYPVALDNQYKTWNAYNNSYWPAHYLIDREGNVRQIHFGEGAYMETENAIRSLLNEPPILGHEVAVHHRALTPETYLGYTRAMHYDPMISLAQDQSKDYSFRGKLGNDMVALEGPWKVEMERITSVGAGSKILLNFLATRVYLVLGGKGEGKVKVMLDGKPLPSNYYTDDMDGNGEISVTEDRKYDIVNLKGDYGRHMLTIFIPEGTSAYAFTFGDE